MMKDIRIASVIFQATVGETETNLTKIVSWSKKAKKAGAEIVCFPELSITGYSNHKDIADVAQTIPGPAADTIASVAKKLDMVILAGLAEKGKNGAIYASHIVVTPGQRIGVYRKLHLAPPELKVFQPGKNNVVFKARGITFGIQLCYDAHFPEISTQMAEKGVEIIFVPHASPRGVAAEKHISWLRHLPARAYDNSVFIVACNQVGPNGMGLFFPGNAVVFSPSGNILKKDLQGVEGLLTVDLEAKSLEHVRGHKMRYFFPNRRHDLKTSETVVERLEESF